MWNYIYFYLYLRKKDARDHNAMEKYVYDKVSEYKEQQVNSGIKLLLFDVM